MATIITKNSSTASAVPNTGDLVKGELAVNVTDKKLYTKDNGGSVVKLVGSLGNQEANSVAITGGTVTGVAQSGGTINNTVIGGTTPAAITGTTVAATSGFSGNLTGNVTGNLTGNVTAASGSSSFTNVTINGTLDVTNTVISNVSSPSLSSDAATKGYVDTAISNLVGTAPGSLDTLGEIADALNDDANIAATLTNSIATKVSKSGDTMSGNLAMGGNKITGLGTPTNGTDAATKDYIDTVFGSTTSAAASAAAAAVSASDAATAYDNFDDRYLGSKAAAPTTDNDGNTLLTGALYWNSVSNNLWVWSGTAWTQATLTAGSFATLTGAETLTNKRINPRVSSTASTSSLTPDISGFDQYNLTALAVTLTINAPIGTPVDGNKLVFRILDNGTTRTINWNGTYTAIGVTLPTATTANKTTYVGCVYNANNTRWDVVAVTTQA